MRMLGSLTGLNALLAIDEFISRPFARLMGRNEVLHQIKLLMEKHVRNGASSPKLIKLRDLMTEHFSMFSLLLIYL